MPQDPYRDGGILLDVRTPAETEAGHFPGALLIPIDELEGRVDEIEAASGGRDRPILVMCRLGRRAERATRLLESRGFSQVCNIGGIDVEPLRSMLGGIRRPGRPTQLDWAWYGLRESAACYDRWLRSLRRGGPPDYAALLAAYQHAYGAELNFRDLGIDDTGRRRAAELRQARLAEVLAHLG